MIFTSTNRMENQEQLKLPEGILLGVVLGWKAIAFKTRAQLGGNVPWVQ